MAEPCEHQQRNPEGTEWSDSDSLNHFPHCKTEQEQADWWAVNRDVANAGYSCQMGNHLGIIASQRQYTRRLLTGVRVLIEQAESVRGLSIRGLIAEMKELIS